jgi:HK97 gp10 family phage protein
LIDIDMSDVQRWGGLLDSEARQVGRRVETAVTEQTTMVVARALAAAPVRFGALRGSIRPEGKGLRRRVLAGNSEAFYARYQEFGTSKMAANPFLVVQANPGTESEFETGVDRALGEGAIYQ